MASKNDTSRQIRLPSELADSADEVFKNLRITFSEGVRLFLAETIRRGRLPFRPDQSAEDNMMQIRKQESNYLDDVLGTGSSAEQRLMKAIFGASRGVDMSDDQLKGWAESLGLPTDKLSTSTLEELYDCGLFPQDVYNSDVSFQMVPGLDGDHASCVLLDMKNIECIKKNIQTMAQQLEAKAISAYLQDAYNDYHRDELAQGGE